ncbi:MAG: beta-ketoacyl-ACP synthase II [Acutalibacteraceae bacterium]|nr:beta-ketoacyl-ACP synthase II [Acutalibacteraceae bacterium]
MRRVVVTGLGCITPLGNDVETTWNNMVNGVCGIDFIKSFDTTDSKAKVAGEVKDFDPLKYIEKRDLRKTDLYVQYALAAAQQAVEDSGIVGNVDENRFGVYVGSGIGGMQTFYNNSVAFYTGGSRKVSPHFIPMMISNIAAGQVAIKFNAKGVCLPIVTACSTGTHELGEAYYAIKHGLADAIIAGGSEAAVTPLTVAGFANCKALTLSEDPKKASTPFDKNRSGFVLGEGAGILILEEYEHAKARGAKIYAEFVGYGNTCDAHHVTAPDPEAVGSARAFKLAFEEAGLKDDEKLYINAHGTSTPANDKGETLAIKMALGDKAYDTFISSTKSMTGHMLGATGGVEAIAAILALKNGVVPPTINLEEPDELCDLNYVPGKAVEETLDIVASSTLGFGGHNAVVVFRKVND